MTVNSVVPRVEHYRGVVQIQPLNFSLDSLISNDNFGCLTQFYSVNWSMEVPWKFLVVHHFPVGHINYAFEETRCTLDVPNQKDAPWHERKWPP